MLGWRGLRVLGRARPVLFVVLESVCELLTVSQRCATKRLVVALWRELKRLRSMTSLFISNLCISSGCLDQDDTHLDALVLSAIFRYVLLKIECFHRRGRDGASALYCCGLKNAMKYIHPRVTFRGSEQVTFARELVEANAAWP